MLNEVVYLGCCDNCGRNIYKDNKFYVVHIGYKDLMMCQYCVDEYGEELDDNTLLKEVEKE